MFSISLIKIVILMSWSLTLSNGYAPWCLRWSIT